VQRVKKKYVEKFANEHLLPSLPGFRVRGNLIYEIPVGNILRAFLFESSGFSATAFYPQVFVQLLYIPLEHLTLTPGKRFLRNWEFVPGDEARLGQRLLHEIHGIGVPFICAHGSPEGVVRETRKNPALEVNPNVRQQLAYSLLMLGRNDEGLNELDNLLKMLNVTSEVQTWERVLHAEVSTLRETLMRSPAETVKTLNEWTETTRMKLGLPE
jgi:hypothetical protein